MPRPRRARASYHHGNLREALLDAAEEVLARDEDLTLRALGRMLRVSHAAVYHHFSDREALLRAVAARGFDRLAAALAAGVRTGGDARGFLDMGVEYVRFATASPALFRLMFGAEAARGRAVDPALRGSGDAAFQVLLDGVRRLQPGGDVEALRRRAVGAWAVVHGLSALLIGDQLGVAGYQASDPARVAREVLGGPPPAQRP